MRNGKPTASDKLMTVLQGQAGVHRVASELMFRGFHVCFPAADSHGIDLMLESGVRIQVKTSSLKFYERTPQGAYWFQFGQNKYDPSQKKIVKVQRNYSKQCDFVILFGIDEAKFWIVPAELFDGASMQVMGREPHYLDYTQEQVLELRATGLSFKEIANRLGGTRMTATRRANGKFCNTIKRGRADAVRKCEDGWYLISELEQSRKPQGQLIEMPPQHEEAVAV